jgi:hypothetical protein
MRNKLERFKIWLNHGPSITLRTFLIAFAVFFIFNTAVLASIMYLVRENEHRVDEIKASVVKSCRDDNEVRSEGRQIIQILKDTPSSPGMTTLQIIQRYDTLIKAQAQLADKRCLK